MAVLDNQPENFSFLSPVGFKFTVNKLPNTNYFCQSANLPGVMLESVPLPTPFVNIPFPGDRIQFQEIIVRFIVDEYMKNWQELYNWMAGLGFPESFDQYQKVLKSDPKNPSPDSGILSDVILTILTGSMTPQVEILFNDAFPIQLAGVQFDTSNEDIQYLTADVTFTYRQFKIKSLLNNE